MSRGTTWRMPVMCDNCPFASSGPGLRLRKLLAPGRWREITDGLRHDMNFNCHKTTAETGDGSELMCAGSIEWMTARGISTNLLRTMERLDASFGRKAAPPETGPRGQEEK